MENKSQLNSREIVEKLVEFEQARHDLVPKAEKATKDKVKQVQLRIKKMQQAMNQAIQSKDKERVKSVEHWINRFKDMLNKLSKAQALVTKITEEDKIRAEKVYEIKDALDVLVDEMNQIPEDSDPDYIKKKAEQKKHLQDMNDLYERISQNHILLDRCYRLAIAYDDDHSDQFSGHWLEVATVILERQDSYGFVGVINYRDLGTKKTPGTGLEAEYSVSYGAVLREGESITYTCPGTKMSIEQDASGKITDHSVYDQSTTEKDKNVAALKCAKLLWLDCMLRQEEVISIKGPASSLEQAINMVAAIHFLAEEAGITMQGFKIDVQIPGWKPSRELDVKIDQAKTSLGQIANASAEFRESVQALRDNDFQAPAVDETLSFRPKI